MNESLNLFKLIETTRKRLSEEGEVKLKPYDLKISIKNFDNNPSPRINFQLYVFNQELGTSFFDKSRNTIDSIVELFVIHSKDDCGYICIRDALISSKIESLNSSLKTEIDKIKSLLKSKYPNETINVEIDETNEKYDNGFPKFVFHVWVMKDKITIEKYNQALSFYGRNFYQSEIFRKIKESCA